MALLGPAGLRENECTAYDGGRRNSCIVRYLVAADSDQSNVNHEHELLHTHEVLVCCDTLEEAKRLLRLTFDCEPDDDEGDHEGDHEGDEENNSE